MDDYSSVHHMANYTLRKVGEHELVFMKYREADKILKGDGTNASTTCERVCPLYNTEECGVAQCDGGYLIKKSLFVHHKVSGEKI